MSTVKVERALVSVSDKTGLAALAERLVAAGVEIVSSGGTAAHLAKAGITVTLVSSVTGSVEILGGRVKTLHPKIHGGILADQRRADHLAELEANDIAAFQLVVVNLYPFEETIAAGGATYEELVEKIDIGGPAMIRAAAKNHGSVGVVTSPGQYEEVVSAVESGGLGDELRRDLAAAAFYRTAAYDAAIVQWLEQGESPPRRHVVAVERADTLRYGENPHQSAGIYRSAEPGWWDRATMVQGKPMSFNNYGDAEAAWRLANDLQHAGAAVIKHANPSGAATAATISEALAAAWECDPVSAFGSVIALNAPLDDAAARFVAERYVEVLIAPSITDDARAILAGKENLRVMEAPAPSHEWDIRGVDGGLLIQDRDRIDDRGAWTVAGKREPSDSEWADLAFAWTVAAHTKSNAIVVAKNGAAVGVGAGDQSRVGAARRALAQAGERATGAVAASDAFFPFPDGVEVLIESGVTAIISPGGSRNDELVLEAANLAGAAMVFTGVRHFRH
ncbi:MAG: bifunctional phosphoribosylaminoimidazolecarboxamide formyltransferase/IMP cyclohydrolase [Acidimicrobiia bacterium]|nr:bifunctional phosphoribosylaminoimidazolecarboxamide formyltransferase/IMP cyclohydrolase [Acidimicrobiia bacterium]